MQPATSAASSALVSLLFACVQAGQGLGENAASALFLLRFGVSYLPYLFIAAGALTFIVTMTYSAGLGEAQKGRFFTRLMLGSALLLIIERLAILLSFPFLYPLVWLTVSALSGVLGTMIWNAAGEVCDARQAKRLFPLFTSAGILGSVAGNAVTGASAEVLGTENLLVLYAVLLGGAYLLMRQLAGSYFPKAKPIYNAKGLRGGSALIQELRGGYDFVRGSGLMRLAAYSAVLFSVLYFSVSYPFSKAVTAAFQDEAQVAGFFGLFNGVTTAATFLVSLLLANRIFARLGIINGVMLMPLAYLFSFAVFALRYDLAGASTARFAQLVILGGVAGTAWSALFNVVPSQKRGQVFAFINGVPSQAGVMLSGVLLIIALWPWNPEYSVSDKEYAHTRKGVDLERVAFFATAVTTVLSALFGAVPGSYFGNGFETFLAENIIRYPEKTTMEYSVIGHLHIMLALIAIMMTLIVGRWLNFQGILHKFAMPLMILGTIVLNLGVWGVVTPLEPVAHMIIYVGATPSMLAAFLLLIWSWAKLMREGTAHIAKPNLLHKIAALVRDPLQFGPTWQMLFMNFTTSGIGIFMAIRLDEIFRVWPAREERIELTGHWHALSAIIATIILLYYGDMIGLKGKVRQLYGWVILILSDIALAAVTVFEMKRLFISEAAQQPLVNGLMLAIDFGLGMLLVLLAIVMVWRLADLFKPRGRWKDEAGHELAQEVMQ